MEQQQVSGRGRVSSARSVLFVELMHKKDFVTLGTGTASSIQVGPDFRDIGRV